MFAIVGQTNGARRAMKPTHILLCKTGNANH